MTVQELAALLNNREYRQEITVDEEQLAKQNRLVVVFGASDDLMEFRGAIRNELDAYEGQTAFVNSSGLLENNCENDACPHFAKLKDSCKKIEQVWDAEGYSWIYKTEIRHATFEILEDGEKYCRGIVFALNDVDA